MNIAIFSDIHGRILLCFKLIARWEAEHKDRIHLILQTGDMGIFPDLNRLDKATRRYAERDPTELGYYHDFRERSERVTEVLARTEAPLIFVRGNHEDHAFLDRLEEEYGGNAVFPVDCYQRLWCLRTGMADERCVEGSALFILGIGRVSPPIGVKNADRPKYIQSHERGRLCSLPGAAVDILLTHDSCLHFVTEGFGSKEIAVALRSFSPAYHFYGHTGHPHTQREYPDTRTLAVKMSDLEWDEKSKGHPLKKDAMGILRWHGRHDHEFSVAEDDWLSEYTEHTWRYL